MQSEPSSSATTAVPDKSGGTLLLRVGELFLRGGNRRAYQKLFAKNARFLLREIGAEVEAAHLRFLVHYPEGKKNATIAILRDRLFGMSSLSPVTCTEADIESIKAEALSQARAFKPGSRFRVDCNRRNKRLPFSSMEVSRVVGGYIHQELGLPVDLKNYEHKIAIDLDQDARVYSEVIPGPGGLPIPATGRVALLFSGGIDSPVAGHCMMRRGCLVQGIYFHSPPFAGEKTKAKVIALARKLAVYQRNFNLHIVHFTDAQDRIHAHVREELTILIYRRMMMRVAEKIAAKAHLNAIVTGDNLGQVASQTLYNLRGVESATELSVLRPLLSYEKSEIIDIARRIGTFDTSILPYQDACSYLMPKRAATRARVLDLQWAEEGLDLEAMAQELADSAETLVIAG